MGDSSVGDKGCPECVCVCVCATITATNLRALLASPSESAMAR